MASQQLIGWDLLFKTIEKDVKKLPDILVAVVHLTLIQNSFQNIGIGDDRTLSPEDVKSELLPEGWNELDNSYALRYVMGSDVYILHAVLTEGTILINLVNGQTKVVSNVSFDVAELVKSQTGALTTLIPSIGGVLDRIRKELVEPVFNGNKKDTQTQTAEAARPRSTADPLRHEPRYQPSRFEDPLIDRRFEDPLRSIGRRDLDPLATGGGMLFNPPMVFDPTRGGFPGLPRGLPPGARFDPYRAPDPEGRFQRPDPSPDHFPPPRFDDDMFM